MATNYAPPSGYNLVIDPEASAVIKLPLSNYPRHFPAGTPMWLNKVAGRYQAEPCLLTTAKATADCSAATATADSGYNSLANANIPFGPLFLGFSLEGRVSQQLQALGGYSVPAPWTNYAQDASRPFLPICTRGQAICRVGPTLGVALATALEYGQLMQVDGFANDAGVVGFYDPAGRLLTSAGAGFWLYMAGITTSTDPTGCIGFVCERAEVGATEIKIQFYGAYNNYLLTLGV